MTTYTSCIDCGGPNYEEHRCMAGQLRQRDETIAKLEAGTCGHHPGMKCTEAHLDDKMKIEKLEKEKATIQELSDLRFRDLCSVQKKLYQVEAENAKLKNKINWDVEWNKAWQHEIKVTAEQSATIRELEEKMFRYEQGLIDIKRHQESSVAGGMKHLSMTWQIANKALLYGESKG